MFKSVWIYDLSTGAFLRGGFAEFTFDPQTEGQIVLVDSVDPQTQKLDLQTMQVVDLSPQEITDRAAATYDARATNAFNGNKVLVAAILALFTVVVKRPPTQQEQDALFVTAKAIYKTL